MSLYPRIAESVPANLPEHPSGSVFYVNSTEGSNDNPGDRREKPFETVTYALAQCTDEYNDVIYVTTSIQVEDQPIVVNKGAVQIIGLPKHTPYAQQARCWFFPDGHVTGGVFTINQSDVLIKNFMFWSTAGQPCINFGEADATDVRITIDQCSFHVGSYGIQTGPGVNLPAHYLTITNCYFDPGLTTGGILLASNGSWPLIANCFFESVAMPNISITGGMAAGRILECLFMLPADSTVGGAIDLGAGPSRWWILGNGANDATNAGITNNPFRDQGTDNIWAKNFIGAAGFTEQAPA